MSLPQEYQRLIDLGIDKSANLPDLNDMTDRGTKPLKPWTASKTCGTMALIKKYNIQDEQTFLTHFQRESKIPIEVLTEQVYQHQKVYFGDYRYDRDTIFKYTYCCIVINSLKGNSTEQKFDRWACSESMIIKEAPAILDEKFHTDRLELNQSGKVVTFISIKPYSFRINYLQYQDVFAGLQAMTNISNIPWKIYYKNQNTDTFNPIMLSNLDEQGQQKLLHLAKQYSHSELQQILPIINKYISND